MSKDQKKVRDQVIAAGGYVRECRSFMGFTEILDEFGIPCMIARR
jgi:hypothetical protein